MARLKTIQWIDNAVTIIDQTRLPVELVYDRIERIEEMREALAHLKVRGAPAIGVAAAFGLFLGVRDVSDKTSGADFQKKIGEKADFLASARPTAVNLFWAIGRMKAKALELVLRKRPIPEIKQRLLDEAFAILEEDRLMCRKIGELGASLLHDTKAILTHCNAGGLATSEYGTALAPVYVAAEQGRLIHVFADETRPLLQGSRITAFELKEAGIPVTVICDNMAATVMAHGWVGAVLVGADRIASNGDTANKIGTYGLALLAKAHGLPFYIAAPSSTLDLNLKTGQEIPIEERSGREITHGFGRQTAPDGIQIFNPAFDVTPASLITAFITDRGVLKPPFSSSIPSVFSK